MANKRKPKKKPTESKPSIKKGTKKRAVASTSDKKWHLIALAIVLISTLAVYWTSPSNEFSNWDDQLYVMDNPNIDLSNTTLRKIIMTPVAANIHPVTMITLALDYSIAELDASQYHLTSLLFHLATALLVYLFVFLLLQGNWLVALLSGLLFAVHPMHVESVAWVSGRKDVVYGFFFIAGLISYLFFLDKKSNWKFYWLALVLFFLSAFAKPAAVVFPVIMLLVDYWRGRKFNGTVWLEKAPFFLVAIIAGVITALVQDDSGAVGEIEKYGIVQRISFAGYGFMQYLRKLFFPSDLAAFYPYPNVPPSGGAYLLYALLALGIVGLAIWSYKKWKPLFFGIGFFAVGVALVLQFVTVGSAIMADRYTYIPYIGLFVLLGLGIDRLVSRNASLKIPLWTTAFAFTGAMAFLGYKQVRVWESSYTLWTDAMSNFENCAPAYKNRGKWYYEEAEDYEKALVDFNVLVELKPKDHEGHLSRGNALLALERYGESAEEYQKSVNLSPDYFDAWYGLARSHSENGNKADAEPAFERAIALKPSDPQLFYSRGLLYRKTRDHAKAIADYSKAIELKPGYSEAYSNRANVHFDKGSYKKAIADYTKALEIDPSHITAHQNRSSTYLLMARKDISNLQLVFQDCQEILEIDPRNGTAYKNLVYAYTMANDIENANRIRQKIKELGLNVQL